MYLSHTIANLLIEIETSKRLADRLDPDKEKLSQAKEKLNNELIFHLINDLGLEVSRKDAAGVLNEKQLVTNDARGKLVENFSLSLNLCDELAQDESIQLSAELIHRINQTIGIGTVEEWQLNYRAAAEKPSQVYDDLQSCIKPGKQLPEEAEESYGSVIAFILEKLNEPGAEHPLLRTSQLAYELLTIQPFIVYNKFTTLFVSRLMLSRYLGAELSLIELGEFFTQQQAKIIDSTQKSEQQESELSWHELFLSIIASQLNKNLAPILEGSHSGKASAESDKPFLDLNRRQLKVLKYLQSIPTLKREDYVQMMEVSAMTAYRDLQGLLKHKLIKPVGTGRGTKYTLVSR
ncbi:MAG: hypothetical protein ACOCXP_04345 [Candidatus Dojkabacteria bacterium]